MDKRLKRRIKKGCDFNNLFEQEVPRSHPTPSASNQLCVSYNHKNQDLQCSFCGLQIENPKLLEIHMRSCMHRKTPLICKLCRNPTKLRGLNKQHYCADCSTAKDGNQEYALRLKTATMAGNLSSKSSKPYALPEKSNYSTINCTNSDSSSQKMATVLDSQKQQKLKVRFAKQQLKVKQTQITIPKIIAAKVANLGKGILLEMDQSSESQRACDKQSTRSNKKTIQQKRNFKEINEQVPIEKNKYNHLLSLKPKTSRLIDQKIKQATRKSDNLSCKKKSSNKKITVKILLDTIPENDCGILLVTSSANKGEHYYRCCRCGKACKSIKLGSIHYANCRSNKLLNDEVSTTDTKWVCTICHSSFNKSADLNCHLKGCYIITKKYDNACERCKKCNFRCLSSLTFQQHDCTKELKSMNTCAVRLNVVKITSVEDRVVMRECEFCSEIFDEQFTEEHFESRHPGEPISGNYKQYYVNWNPGVFGNTVIVKSEQVQDYDFQDRYKRVPTTNNSSLGSDFDNFSMPPPPPPQNFPVVQSTASLPSSSHSASNSASIINQQICNCVHRNLGNDIKPCVKCLGKMVDITEVEKNFKVVPYRLAEIKKETSECSKILNSQLSDCTVVPSAQNGGEVEDIDSSRNLFPFPFLDAFQPNPSLTPPSSHDGTSPPPTPLVPSFANGEPCSASDISIGSINDAISMVPDISQLDEPRCPDELVHYINNDCSSDLPLMQCDDQELFTAINSSRLTHLWDADDLDNVDAWAIVPSDEHEKVEKYICSKCIAFSCSDQNTIIMHLCQNHEKKIQFLAMYIPKTEDDLRVT